MAYPKIEGERLDIMLQRLREKGESAAIPATDEFRALLDGPGDKPVGGRESLHTLLIDFIMPIIKDAGIFHENRTIMLLEYLRDVMLPKLLQDHESRDTIQLLTRAVNDEIARYSDLRERRQAGIAA